MLIPFCFNACSNGSDEFVFPRNSPASSSLLLGDSLTKRIFFLPSPMGWSLGEWHFLERPHAPHFGIKLDGALESRVEDGKNPWVIRSNPHERKGMSHKRNCPRPLSNGLPSIHIRCDDSQGPPKVWGKSGRKDPSLDISIA